MLKFLSESEYTLLTENIFEEYVQHVLQENSFIVKIVGIFEAEIYNKGQSHLMIMKNVIPLNYTATHIFDIKGSE